VSSGYQGLAGWPCEPVIDLSQGAAPTSSSFFVSLTVAMPYLKAEFNSAKQLFFKSAVAGAAGTDAANVDIVSVTETSRRAGSIDVETKVLLLFRLGLV